MISNRSKSSSFIAVKVQAVFPRPISSMAIIFLVSSIRAMALREKYGEKLNIVLADVNPTAGSHCGPDTVGVCFHAIHR